MSEWLDVLWLGIIEGVTEFLPISSTGHLLIAEHWLGARSELFNVGIQAGAMLAVLLIYRERLLTLLLGLHQRDNRDYIAKLCAAFLVTCVGGLAAKKLGLSLPETVQPVAWALIIGGIAILLIERHAERLPVSAQLTWKIALIVGAAQILAAVFPGTSRSAATIFAAMLAGLNSRPQATEFAFLLGIPTMFAASGYEFLKLAKAGALHQENWSLFGFGLLVSAVVAFIAVKWLLRYVQSHRFTVFAWYRIALGAALLVLLPA
ncbi:undecaprenyl-diphosphatase [Solimonas aquatica]|uniref:Undecaprenyl-diphosphatase n=1 Tax=Solimonas aquatica TaxID=489703 RepID=A0A1H9EV66_9GAMM|nr:undecaprenyl-diphosphate phosphatase [Solimonas aquatica]SEQ29646.1 undecaprenyl-diphosphatase [Solimonas aquatica]